MPETQPSSPQGANLDPWRDLRVLNDLDLGALAHKAGCENFPTMLRALPLHDIDRMNTVLEVSGTETWTAASSVVACHGARLRAALPLAPDAELDALSTYLGQPRGRLLEGAQRLVEHNDELRTSRDQWRSWAVGTAGNGWAGRAAALLGHQPSLHEGDDRARELLALGIERGEQHKARANHFEGIIVPMGSTLEDLRAKHGEATTALLAIGSALEVVGTHPWAEIGKAGVAAVEAAQVHLKTARQGWADESAAACRARVERDKSRAEVATLQEQVARLRTDVTRAEQVSARYVSDALAGQRAAKDEVVSWETAAKMLLFPLSQDWSGDRLRARTFEYAMGGWQRADVLSRELTTLCDAARTLLPADSTPNPATGWLADVICGSGATVTGLRAQVERSAAKTRTLEAEVISLTASLRSLRERRDDACSDRAELEDLIRPLSAIVGHYPTLCATLSAYITRAKDSARNVDRLSADLEAAKGAAAPSAHDLPTTITLYRRQLTETFEHWGRTAREVDAAWHALGVKTTRHGTLADQIVDLRDRLTTAEGALTATRVDPCFPGAGHWGKLARAAGLPELAEAARTAGSGEDTPEADARYRITAAVERLARTALKPAPQMVVNTPPPTPAADLEPLRRAASALIDAAAALALPRAA